MVTLSVEVGERIMKFGHFAYVDATVGNFIGLGMSGFRPTAGLTGTIAAHVIGEGNVDYGIFLKAMLPFADEVRNTPIVFGVSGRF